MYTLRVRDHFDAAHFLPWHEGKCKNLHGHRWEVEVVLETKKLDENGIMVDFALVKDIIKRVIPDHKPLNIGEFMSSLSRLFPEYKSELAMMSSVLGNWLSNPTAERISEAIYLGIEKEIYFEELDFNLVEVTVWESPNCSAVYKPERKEWYESP